MAIRAIAVVLCVMVAAACAQVANGSPIQAFGDVNAAAQNDQRTPWHETFDAAWVDVPSLLYPHQIVLPLLKPLMPTDMQAIASRVMLSDAQVAAMQSPYRAYLTSWVEQVQAVEAGLQCRSADLAEAKDQSLRSEREEAIASLLDQVYTVGETYKAFDRGLFEAILPLVAEVQSEELERMRLRRERAWMTSDMCLSSPSQDLAVLFEEHRVGMSEGPIELTPELRELLDTYEQEYTSLLRTHDDLHRRTKKERRAAYVEYLKASQIDSQAAHQVYSESHQRIQQPHIEIDQRLFEFQRRCLKQLCAALPEHEAGRYRFRVNRTMHFRVVGLLEKGDAMGALWHAVESVEVTDEVRLALREACRTHERRWDEITETMIETQFARDLSVSSGGFSYATDDQAHQEKMVALYDERNLVPDACAEALELILPLGGVQAFDELRQAGVAQMAKVHALRNAASVPVLTAEEKQRFQAYWDRAQQAEQTQSDDGN